MKKKELLKAHKEGLIDDTKLKEELFNLELLPKDRRRSQRKLPKSITTEEFKKLIGVIPEKDKISKTAFLLAYGSGLRISEIVGGREEDQDHPIKALTKDKLDFTRGQIRIEDAKYGVSRIVPIPKGWKDYMTAILPIKKTARTLQRKFKKYSKKAGLNPEYVFHSLRHGFGTRLIESGVPISHVQALLGHSNVSTTSTYIKARPTDALKSYEELF